ncbi:tRNA (guanosine(18)-2'-O)-methyltransferase TrmH [Alloalcanivorax gelatiniphagus]|uniref:tRNA (guanosine(18)-2'-O)-methyltransferase n=1 Tax=Alloalcanivorax gelatiniphagus TaxID=1194167 RepID=A0ABY2XS19_9GAMM|nr:tRNA (guanosine(18)-2'-O)-methyltransferase TrmH [Alloalcanivorax gelatiniphagus]TMW14731.1 tRNA (guanosine(18)-2'-O)-methyltransferase TrmH [Alloalcanivorax gelatiniphagus]|tara:strand:- start:9790 stop:10491 length:702 start_codon:yes stop_codon:yes gene_type:complete
MTPQRLQRLRATLARRQPDLSVIMDGVHKPHNIAAVVRTCDAVGVLELHAALPDNRARNTVSTALGSQRWVNVHEHHCGEDAIRHVQSLGMQVLAAHWSEHAVPYREVDYTRPTALLLGTERTGVDDISAAAADRHVIIPMMGMVSSFNVSVAAAIILAEACEQRRAAGLYQQSRLNQQQYRDTFFKWAYPKLAEHCRRFGVPYPELREDGEIANPGRFNFQLSEAIRAGQTS